MKHNILKFLKLNIAVLAVFSMTSCLENTGNGRNKIADDAQKFARGAIDYEADLTRDEIRDALRPSKTKAERDEKETADRNQIPDDLEFKPIVISPTSPEIKSNKRVSLTVSENIDVRDVLLELARLAELELALDPYIKGGIVLNVNNRPVNEVIEIVSDLADLRYTVENGVLKVMRDAPYLVNYSVDYLNLTRSGSGTITTSTKVLSISSGGGGEGGSGGGGGGGNFNSGSDSEITSSYTGDLWSAIETNLDSIIAARTSVLSRGSQSIDTPASSTQPAPQQSSANLPEGFQETVPTEIATNTTQSNSGGQTAATAGAGASSTATSAQRTSGPVTTYFTVNRQAGVISVMASYKKHKMVKEYLDKLKKSLSAQVLIEAKVIEVELSQNYARGIDWSAVKIGGTKFGSSSGGGLSFKTAASAKDFAAGVFTTNVQPTGSFSWTKPNHNTASLALEFIEKFGVTRVLQNPRVTVMNNQQAILSFATNEIYYTVSSTATTTPGTNGSNSITTVNATSTANTIPVGVILSLQPSIDLDKEEITMHIRPTLSQKTGTAVPDPAVEINKLNIGTNTGVNLDALKEIKSEIPQIQVRELDTVLKARSGEVMVLGGLINHRDSVGEAGVPYLSDIPILGSLAKNSESRSAVVETVILIQATIVAPELGNTYHPQDKKIYDTFTQDPRPAIFN